MRVAALITGGGTGGHIYPALAVMRSLRSHLANGQQLSGSDQPARAREDPDHDCLIYLGNARGMEAQLVPETGVPAYLYPMAPPSSPRGVILLALATVRSLVMIGRYRPAVTIGTGGYVSVPASIASWLLRVPVVLYLPDVVPGKAVRVLIPLARRIATSTDDALRYLPANKTVVTGYPVRDEFLHTSREAARRRFGLPSEATVLCVFGGSLGARSINQALARRLPDLLARFSVIHVCGRERLVEAEHAMRALSPEQRSSYRLYPYLEAAAMADALAAADLAVCRSGASVLGELPASGTPSVLVPLPIPGVHQRENAQYLAEHGAAVVLDNDDLDAGLGPLLMDLLGSPARLEEMATACRALFRPDAADRIAEAALGVAG